jgi:hypothetical protein
LEILEVNRGSSGITQTSPSNGCELHVYFEILSFDARLKVEEEATRQAEEDVKQKAEEESKLNAEEEAKRQAEEEEARLEVEEEVKQKTETNMKCLVTMSWEQRTR